MHDFNVNKVAALADIPVEIRTGTSHGVFFTSPKLNTETGVPFVVAVDPFGAKPSFIVFDPNLITKKPFDVAVSRFIEEIVTLFDSVHTFDVYDTVLGVMEFLTNRNGRNPSERQIDDFHGIKNIPCFDVEHLPARTTTAKKKRHKASEIVLCEIRKELARMIDKGILKSRNGVLSMVTGGPHKLVGLNDSAVKPNRLDEREVRADWIVEQLSKLPADSMFLLDAGSVSRLRAITA